ncbi:MAG TPA: Gmad2 immunoglobulin-like domain-containing protein [Candidatus Paceibacterota bacterium]|jgi:hypothetical protein|nr:Gmad2 immunoglobulin-like domain-containing protein [Candidatus Paceibacterota bacterium]
MQKRYLLIVIIGLFAFSLWGVIHTLEVNAPQTTNSGAQPPVDVPGAPAPIQNNQIMVDNLVQGQIITSPLKITGKATGNWYFEGVFPVSITDLNGNVVATGQAQAQSSWTTADYVPFATDIPFDTNSMKSGNGPTYGYVILKNSNPSGDPQFDKSLSIKVQW